MTPISNNQSRPNAGNPDRMSRLWGASSTDPTNRIAPGAARVRTATPSSSEDTPIRSELVARIRAQIEAGTYDSDAKLEAACDRLASILDVTA